MKVRSTGVLHAAVLIFHRPLLAKGPAWTGDASAPRGCKRRRCESHGRCTPRIFHVVVWLSCCPVLKRFLKHHLAGVGRFGHWDEIRRIWTREGVPLQEDARAFWCDTVCTDGFVNSSGAGRDNVATLRSCEQSPARWQRDRSDEFKTVMLGFYWTGEKRG